MRSLLIFVVVLLTPQIVFCDSENIKNNNDNEKYMQNLPNNQQSLYCNDLNPQMHLDFNMVMMKLNKQKRFILKCER